MNKNYIKSEKNKIFFENVGNLGLSHREYIIEGQISHQKILDEECPEMKDKIIVVNQFKKQVRKSLSNFKIDLYRGKTKILDNEVLSDELVENGAEFLDEYTFLENQVVVMDFKMTIKNDLLYEVLNSMEQQQRDIVYLSLCKDMSDKKISEKLKLSRSSVQRIKQSMKKRIYDAMTGGSKHEDWTYQKTRPDLRNYS